MSLPSTFSGPGHWLTNPGGPSKQNQCVWVRVRKGVWVCESACVCVCVLVKCATSVARAQIAKQEAQVCLQLTTPEEFEILPAPRTSRAASQLAAIEPQRNGDNRCGCVASRHVQCLGAFVCLSPISKLVALLFTRTLTLSITHSVCVQVWVMDAFIWAPHAHT